MKLADEINAGSVVRLKSGGPSMTVKWAGDSRMGEHGAYCEWFVQDKAPWKTEGKLFPLSSFEASGTISGSGSS
jgi:uncharacterized protein YodC (DUF2158 family)